MSSLEYQLLEHLRNADMYFQTGHFVEARSFGLAVLDRISSLKPTSTQHVYGLSCNIDIRAVLQLIGLCSLRLCDYSAAIAYAAALLSRDSTYTAAHLLVADTMTSVGWHEATVYILERLCMMAPNLFVAHTRLVRACVTGGGTVRARVAIAACEKLLYNLHNVSVTGATPANSPGNSRPASPAPPPAPAATTATDGTAVRDLQEFYVCAGLVAQAEGRLRSAEHYLTLAWDLPSGPTPEVKLLLGQLLETNPDPEETVERPGGTSAAAAAAATVHLPSSDFGRAGLIGHSHVRPPVPPTRTPATGTTDQRRERGLAMIMGLRENPTCAAALAMARAMADMGQSTPAIAALVDVAKNTKFEQRAELLMQASVLALDNFEVGESTRFSPSAAASWLSVASQEIETMLVTYGESLTAISHTAAAAAEAAAKDDPIAQLASAVGSVGLSFDEPSDGMGGMAVSGESTGRQAVKFTLFDREWDLMQIQYSVLHIKSEHLLALLSQIRALHARALFGSNSSFSDGIAVLRSAELSVVCRRPPHISDIVALVALVRRAVRAARRAATGTVPLDLEALPARLLGRALAVAPRADTLCSLAVELIGAARLVGSFAAEGDSAAIHTLVGECLRHASAVNCENTARQEAEMDELSVEGIAAVQNTLEQHIMCTRSPQGALVIAALRLFATAASLSPCFPPAWAGAAAACADLHAYAATHTILRVLLRLFTSPTALPPLGSGVRGAVASAVLSTHAASVGLVLPLDFFTAQAWLVFFEHVDCVFDTVDQNTAELERMTRQAVTALAAGPGAPPPPVQPLHAMYYAWSDDSVIALCAVTAAAHTNAAALELVRTGTIEAPSSTTRYHATPLAMPPPPQGYEADLGAPTGTVLRAVERGFEHVLLPTTYSAPTLLSSLSSPDVLASLDLSVLGPAESSHDSISRALQPDGKITIGFLFSSGVGSNSETRVLAPVLKHFDPALFRIVVFAPCADDSPYTALLGAGCSEITVYSPSSPAAEIADLISSEGVHVLLDIFGPSGFGNIHAALALRPAPVQVSALFFPGVPAAEYIDYVLVDPVVAPPEGAAIQHMGQGSAGVPICRRGAPLCPGPVCVESVPRGPRTAVAALPPGVCFLPGTHAVDNGSRWIAISDREAAACRLSPLSAAGVQADDPAEWVNTPRHHMTAFTGMPFTNTSTTNAASAALTGALSTAIGGASISVVPDLRPPRLPRELLPPGRGPARSAMGIPPASFVIAAVGASVKFSAGHCHVLVHILRADPRTFLIIAADPHDAVANITAHISGLCAAYGQPEVMERVSVWERPATAAERARAFALCVDLLLDTPGTSGLTTVADALWAGVPVVTLPGSRPSSRAAASILMAAGLPDLAVTSVEEYIALCNRMVNDHGFYTQVRDRISAARKAALAHRPGTPSIFNPHEWVRSLEHMATEMVRRWALGVVPGSCDVVLSYVTN